MNTFSNISSELKAYFSSHSILKILLPIDMVLIFAGLIFMVINGIFPGLGLSAGFFGGLLSAVAYWAFIFGLLFAFANYHQQYLYIGMMGYGAFSVLMIIFYLFRRWGFSWSFLFDAAVFGGLGYLVFARSTSSGSSQQT
ncbi:MAG: hypothetical protein Q7J78_02605 [Clostridiales bacterium]|nr:hypothetical protein [Clostridiales bacterium]